ncbi:MAG TPA: hypothetical protein VGC40_07780 [Paenirhodobacter sp.]
MKAILLPTLAFALIAGCNDPGFRGTTAVRVASADEVGACRFIENVSVKPGVYGPILGDQGVKYSRNQLLDMARADGANTVVFDQVDPCAAVYVVSARAFAC